MSRRISVLMEPFGIQHKSMEQFYLGNNKEDLVEMPFLSRSLSEKIAICMSYDIYSEIKTKLTYWVLSDPCKNYTAHNRQPTQCRESKHWSMCSAYLLCLFYAAVICHFHTTTALHLNDHLNFAMYSLLLHPCRLYNLDQ